MGAWAQGWDLGSQAAKTQGDHTRALSDQEHELALGTYNNAINSLQQKMSQVGPNDPGYGDLQNQLSQTLDARTSLFHPSRPGGLARLGAMVFGAMQKHPPAPKMPVAAAPVAAPAGVPETAAPASYTNELGDAVNPASLRQRFAGTNELGAQLPAAEAQAPPPAAAAPAALSPLAQAAVAAVPTRQNPLIQGYRDSVEAGVKAGLSPEQAQENAQQQLKITMGIQAKPVSRLDRLIPLGKPVSDGQGGYVQPMRHADGTISNQPLPTGWTPPSATPSNSALAVQRREYAKERGIDEKDLTFDDELNIRALLAQAAAGTTSATHTTFQTINGQVTPIQETTTSGKKFNVQPITKVPPTTPPTADQTPVPASALKTPGTLKKQVAAVSGQTTSKPSNAGMGIKVGDPIGEKPTGAQTKADEAYNDATKLNALADNVVKTKEPGQQKQLALALIKAMAGRVNMQEYSIYTKGYGVPNTIAGLVQGIENGGLAPGVVDQLVKSAKANLIGARAAQVQSRKAFKADDGPSVDDVLKALKGGG